MKVVFIILGITFSPQSTASILGGQALVQFAQSEGEAVVLKRFAHHRDYDNEIEIIHRLGRSPYLLAPISFNADRKEIMYRRARDGDLYNFEGLKDLQYHDLVSIVWQIIFAVGTVHEAGYLHLDIKPENFVREGLRVWLIDFGLASKARDAPRNVGTPRTMAPEALLPAASWVPMSVAADWWSTGVTIFHIFARYLGLSPEMHFNQFPYRLLYRKIDGKIETFDWPASFPKEFPPMLLDLLFGRRGLLSLDFRNRLLAYWEILLHPFFKFPLFY